MKAFVEINEEVVNDLVNQKYKRVKVFVPNCFITLTFENMFKALKDQRRHKEFFIAEIIVPDDFMLNAAQDKISRLEQSINCEVKEVRKCFVKEVNKISTVLEF